MEGFLRQCVVDDTLAEYLVNAIQRDLEKFPLRGESSVEEREINPATFLQRWSNIVQSNFQRTYLTAPYPYIFSAQIHQPASDAIGEQSQYITEIFTPVSRELSDAGTHSILDALQAIIWWGENPACLKTFSEILLIRLKREDREGGAGVEILPRLPMGRFAYDYYNVTEERIRMKRGLTDTLDKLRRRDESITWVEKMGKKYSAAQILAATIEYIETVEGKTLIDLDVEDEDNPSRMDIDSDTTLPMLSNQLKASVETLNNKRKGANSAEFY